jgi:hypothetical protein
LLNIMNTYNQKKSEGERAQFCREVQMNEKSMQKAIKIKA